MLSKIRTSKVISFFGSSINCINDTSGTKSEKTVQLLQKPRICIVYRLCTYFVYCTVSVKYLATQLQHKLQAFKIGTCIQFLVFSFAYNANIFTNQLKKI